MEIKKKIIDCYYFKSELIKKCKQKNRNEIIISL